MKVSVSNLFAAHLACRATLAAAYYLPGDNAHHAATLMTWPTAHSTYRRNVTATRLEIASIIGAIGRHEPVKLFVYNDTDNIKSAKRMLGNNSAVTIFPTSHVDSLWARDTGPIFVQRSRSDKDASGIVLNFNEWGHKLGPPTRDRQTARAVLTRFGIHSVVANFTSEGGALEPDGEGTMMATESSILNDNRNPGKTKSEIEQQFAELFGIKKTIWLKGSKGTDITDSHVDALARFVKPGVVALTRPNPAGPRFAIRMYENAKKILSESTDAMGRQFKVVEVPDPENPDFAHKYRACIQYNNWYSVNGAIIMAGFGDQKADAYAKGLVERLFPDRKVEQVQLRQLALQGGGIHCATQQILSPVEK